MSTDKTSERTDDREVTVVDTERAMVVLDKIRERDAELLERLAR